MTSKERIKKILNFEIPDRIGIYDQFWNETRIQWSTRIGIESADLEGHFGIDISILIKNQKPTDNKFCVISVVDPFEDVANAIGLQNVLAIIGQDPADVISDLKKSAAKTMRRLEKNLKSKTGIDGAWLWSDIAGDAGLFFSPEFYKNYLLPLHRQICAFFGSLGLPVILHSDGNINDIIPDVIKAGFKAIHPVESRAGMRVTTLKKKYKGELAFLGNMSIDLIRYARDKEFLSKVIRKEIETAKQDGGYIFGFENPISPEIDLDMYSIAVNAAREYGRY